MVHHSYTGIRAKNLIERAKIKKDLIKILRKHGFKRVFFKHPASEIYVKGDFKAEVYSGAGHDSGSREHGRPYSDYWIAGVGINGPKDDPKLDKMEKELSDYYGQSPKQRKESRKKREQKTSGIENRIGIFAAFIVAGVALSLGSMTITGNAISNLTQTTPGLLGILFFIAGLVGVFFCSRKK